MGIGIPAGREIRRQFWLLVRAGVLHRQAAAALGLNRDTGREWFRQAGGVVPTFLTLPLSDRFLAFAEREEIFAGVERGDSIRLMAKRLGRSPSTVLRELRRNMRQPYRARWGPPPRGDRRRTRPWDIDRAARSSGRNAGRPGPSRPSSPPIGGCAMSSRPNCSSS